MISILDYGSGNIRAIQNVYKSLGIKVQTVKSSMELKKATKIILPGVGSFDYAIELISKIPFYDELITMVLEKKIPVLGICVGMQIMCNSSQEGKLNGLNWFDGLLKSFPERYDHKKIIIPHMGWNSVSIQKNSILFKDIPDETFFYFLHSFYLVSKYKGIVSHTTYNKKFISSFEFENIYGVQFHPEKSHEMGAKLLDNFARFS